MDVWTIYHYHQDARRLGRWVLRRSRTLRGNRVLVLSTWACPSLEHARLLIPRWKRRYPRHRDEPRTIVEVWL